MRGRLTAALHRSTSSFASFTAGQKAITVVAILALAVGGYFFATWAGQPTYAPLYTSLAPADASAIVDKLTADGVSYQLADGGSTILVPADQVYAERIKVSGAGLPAQSDAGYALLDQQDAMTSEFMQQVGYRRALEGELAKTIKSMDGVNTATVHLAIPKKDVFADEQQQTTASVLISTPPGKHLGSDQVQAVVHLVASSIEGLDPEQVTVVGSDGSVLSATGPAATAAGSQRARQTQEFEQRMNTALQRMLDQALGPSHAVVQVTADLDFDSTETTTQKYMSDPNNPPLSEQTKTESYTGTGTPTGGVLGPDNIQVPGGTGDGTGTYEQTTETRNNAVGLVTETRKSAPGAVRKLAVAVLLDSAVAQDEDAARLQQLVSSAAGLDTARGDTVAVTAMEFDTTAAEQAQEELAEAEKSQSDAELKSWIETGALVLGVLVLLVMALLSGRKKKRQRTELTPEELTQLDEMQAAIEDAKKRELEGAAPTATAGELEGGSPDDGELEFSEQVKRRTTISGLIERQPEEVAQLLRGWLADRRG
ncbi:MAG: flagellar M-ring protein FliF [Dactylosporangium sp.]|nr:flagellar M-ring protein FliF [Dactylosporangium sp.]NNJ61980.1 flagellar M-ring protein FliF [Dactylosporangium sp.]